MDRACHGAQPGEDPHPATSRARPDRKARAGARGLAPTFLQSLRHGTLGDFAAGGPSARHDTFGYPLGTAQNASLPSDWPSLVGYILLLKCVGWVKQEVVS